MEKTYKPEEIERPIYEEWERAGWFAPDPARADADPYCIMLPPPNVTGTLHMGHAFQDTIMDTLIRYHRMKGDQTLWQGGSDHAGIATQMVVERQLESEGKDRHDLGREAFLERVWTWKAESGGHIQRQMRRLGASVDWSRDRFTMDEGLSAAVTEVFVRLHEDGLIYRGKRLVNWDPVLHTALSDLEVLSEEESGHLWHLRYPLSDGSGQVIVATTRPETMLGDTAVAVHPEDERYRHLIGKTIRLPLAERDIPVIADDYVDPEFGSGCVKITPAHDFNDYEIGKRHDLPLINVLTPDARIGEEAPEAYRGLDRYEARERVLSDLRDAGLLERTDEHKLMVPRGDRSGAVVEPYLTDQWYVDLTRETQPDGRPGGLAAITRPALEAVSGGDIRFVPGNWAKTYEQWLENIQDWCISRQLWWGHRVPAWYDPDGNIHVGRDEADARARSGLSDDVPLAQDEDVLDTWFSSALWPFSTLGWPEATPELSRFYPTSVLVTGFDIIFFWVARMVMMGRRFMDDVPFREVYIHGLIRDADGQKMSKSKGNVLDPLDLIEGISLEELVAKRTAGLMQPHLKPRIEKTTRRDFPDGIQAFGTDALRFTFAALATTGRDIRFDLGRVEGYRNFCNKIWNASRYVLMNTEDEDCGLGGGELERSLADRWILSCFNRTVQQVRTQIEAYRFDLAAKALYEFTWHQFCDWYLEISKPVLTGEAGDAAKRGTRRTLVTVLEGLMRLMHPVMPFITESIWRRVAPLAGVEGETVMRQPFPEADPALVDEAVEAEMEWVQGFILGVRQIRGEMDISPGKPLPVLVARADETDRARLETHRVLLTTLARLESVEVLADETEAPESAMALVGDTQILVPMAGLIDAEAELERLDRRIAKLEQELTQGEKKLANENFLANAPPEVVQGARDRVTETRISLEQLQGQREKVARLA